MKYIRLLVLLSVLFTSCEGLDDTFSKNIPEGKERYTGKCENLIIEKGWKRLKLTWDNSIDPARDSIKIVWKGQDYKDSVIIDGSSTSYITDTIFEDQNYEFNVYSIDINGKHSIKTTSFGKPYTEESELIMLLRKVEEKHFILDDNLILFLYQANRQIADVKINYYEKNSGDLIVEHIDSTDFANKFLHVQNVDFNKPVTFTSEMKLIECFDTIKFAPYSLDTIKRSFNADFLAHFKRKFDLNELEFESLKDIEEVYFDENVSSLEDLLYLPNLKKVYLGKNRYVSYLPSYHKKYASQLFETDRSIYALIKLNELKGVTVELYGDHYGLKNLLPGILNYHSASSFNDSNIQYFDDIFNSDGELNWNVSANYGLDASSSFMSLFDKNNYSLWRPVGQKNASRKHEIIIDMKEAKDVGGFVFTQAGSSSYFNNIPETIKVKVSNDLNNWESPFSTYEDIKLNYYRGEQTIVNFPESSHARYIKIILTDKYYYSGNFTVIGDFIPFK